MDRLVFMSEWPQLKVIARKFFANFHSLFGYGNHSSNRFRRICDNEIDKWGLNTKSFRLFFVAEWPQLKVIARKSLANFHSLFGYGNHSSNRFRRICDNEIDKWGLNTKSFRLFFVAEWPQLKVIARKSLANFHSFFGYGNHSSNRFRRVCNDEIKRWSLST